LHEIQYNFFFKAKLNFQNQIEERLVSITYANILGHLFQNQRIEECVLRTQMLLLPAKVNRSITPERKSGKL
jgi:hypothetical protein